MSQVQRVKDAIAIEEVIGERVSLTRSGNYFRGLCPFHSEKSPSFFVSPQMQRFKCFGCAAAGDAFEFLQRYEGLTFYEALQLLAERAGITLEQSVASPADQERERLREALNLAKEYYHYILTKHEAGEPARAYLKERGISQESIKIFQLGYALPQWDGLINFLHGKKKYSLSELVKVGLIVANQRGRQYDRFRDRIIFPLNDARGRVVGFSGRVLDPTIKTAKYINSPETEFYHKSQLLYGFSELFQEIRKKEELIVVEGEIDVISSSQAHVNHIVAIKGSALTPDHARIMRRVVERVILALDADDAGIEATKRAIPICTEAGLELRIIKVPEGKDPDELARKNPELWRKTAAQSLSVYAYLLEVALQQHDTATPEGQRKIIDELAPIFAHITHAVEKEFYLKKLAEALGVRMSIIQTDIAKFGQKKAGALGKSAPAAADKKAGQAIPQAKELTHRQRLERYLWHIWLTAELKQQRERWSQLQQLTWQLPQLGQLITQINNLGKLTENWTQQLPTDQQQILFDIAYDPQLSTNLQAEKDGDAWSNVLQQLKKLLINDRVEEITRELDALDEKDELQPADEARQHELLEEIVKLRQQQG